jgi:hypothetical protein
MPYDMSNFGDSKWVRTHPNHVYTHGSMEPVLSVLDVRGFELRDLFLIGFNDSCGTLVLPTESRAENAAAALEPAFATKVQPGRRGRLGDRLHPSRTGRHHAVGVHHRPHAQGRPSGHQGRPLGPLTNQACRLPDLPAPTLNHGGRDGR